jgi:hypothetical protein
VRTVAVVAVVLGQPDTVARVAAALEGTSAEILVVDSVAALGRALAERLRIAAVVVDEEVEDAAVPAVVRLLPDDAQHLLLVVRQGDVATDVPWTVVRRSELRLMLPILVADREAIVVDLLASVRPASRPTAPADIGCVVSVGSRFLMVALDDPPPDPTIAFVLPGAGRLVVTGSLEAVWGRTGLWRLSPDDESVRGALLAFTLRQSDVRLGEPGTSQEKLST